MKSSLIVAVVVVLALVHGSQSVSLVKREAPDMERLGEYFKEIAAQFQKTTDELVQKLKTQDLQGQAQSYLEDSRAQLQPLADKIQEQLKPMASNLEEQFKPMADTMKTKFEEFFNQMMEQAKALTA